MAEPTKDVAVMTALVMQFETQSLPRALALKEKVDHGVPLNDWDTAFLSEVLETARKFKPLVDQHPEYQGLYAQAAHLYMEITEKGLEKATSARNGD